METMTLKVGAEADWATCVAVNDDPYGRAVVEYANAWALLMERRMAGGEALEAVARDTSDEADTDGITGFMYGCAVSILAAMWVHGEALRRWHNLETQIHEEGERANESGGVLNPALLIVASGEWSEPSGSACRD